MFKLDGLDNPTFSAHVIVDSYLVCSSIFIGCGFFSMVAFIGGTTSLTIGLYWYFGLSRIDGSINIPVNNLTLAGITFFITSNTEVSK